ncbi:cupin domain-containing protein [Albidovulum sediminicola]|uniref:Cupin domain-containing protein n=1 Tax=Albidovulum sediminicola TaxID=2984331 RepID=A0ABT2YXX8_9RHOB|nr:cupin domain-containing protein [Defluviimonas sp. WL0075]MCV2863371.1 cupin domain-containing protein [Defluviimonas sp. WL0075]
MTPSEAALWFLNTRVRIVVPAASGADGLSVIRHWAPYGDSPPLHVHDTEDEVFHVLEGRVLFSVDGALQEVTAGQTLMAPKGVPHSYVVESPEGAKWLTVTRPGDFEALVRETSRPASGPGLPPAGHPTPEMKAHLAEVCARHGIRLVGAPLTPRQPAE